MRTYDLIVYFGGHFMTCLKYQYTGPKYKWFRKIEVGKMSVRDIRDMVKDVVNDEDRMYFAKDAVTPDHGFKLLLTDSDVQELVRVTKNAGTGICKIHVFHSYSTATPPNVEDEGSNMDGLNENAHVNEHGSEHWNEFVAEHQNGDENEVGDGNQGGDVNKIGNENQNGDVNKVGDGDKLKKRTKMTARKRVKMIQSDSEEDDEVGNKSVSKGKEKVFESESENESEGDSEYEMEDLNEELSDEEFADIRKMRAEMRQEHEILLLEQSQMIKDTLLKYREGGTVGGTVGGTLNDTDNNSMTSGSIYAVGSEEETDEDEEFAYAEPNLSTKRKRVNEPFNPCTAGKDIKWRVGLIFSSKKEFKNAVVEFSIATGRPLRYGVDDLHRISVICAEGCPFRMWVSYMLEFEGWQIKTVNNEHNCIYHFSNKLVTVNYLAEMYGDRIRRNPNWKLTEMQEEFRRVMKVEVCDAKCCRVRKKALSGIEEEMVRHYAGLRRFGGELLRSNRENTVKITTTRLNESDAPRFQRFYVCYAELKKGWREGCRPVLGLDGCFIKTVCGGQLLSAVGRDGNNSIFPIAMAVVETESYDSWKWFLMLLNDDLELGSGYGYTFISDQQKGLEKAVKELLPHVEHRNCTRHIYSNLQKKHGNEAVRIAFYQASMATHVEAFKTAMKNLEKASKKAAERLKAFEPKVWSKAYFQTNSKTESTENNISECFNSWILKARYMPLIDMLTEIHDMIMERLHQKRDAMINVDCIILPRVKTVLDEAVRASSECTVLWDGRSNFQVKWRGIGFCVNLNDQTCSCRVWDLTGVPCCHAVCAIQRMRKNPIDYVSHYFKKEAYMKTYSHCLEVVRGEPFWEEVEGDTILPPPKIKKLRGRPKRQRRREGWEGGSSSKGMASKLSRQGRVMHCSNCKKPGHNITKCPEAPQGGTSTVKKGGRKRKTSEEEEAEMERIEVEMETGEAELMEEALRNEEFYSPPPPPNTPRRSQRLAEATQSSIHEDNVRNAVFMPTPGLRQGIPTGGTPTADRPGTSKKKGKGAVKAFIAPRKK